MTFHFAKTVDEVLNIALEPASKPKRIKVQNHNGQPEKVPATAKVETPLPESIKQPNAPPASA
jgi:hypothetical protein